MWLNIAEVVLKGIFTAIRGQEGIVVWTWLMPIPIHSTFFRRFCPHACPNNEDIIIGRCWTCFWVLSSHESWNSKCWNISLITNSVSSYTSRSCIFNITTTRSGTMIAISGNQIGITTLLPLVIDFIEVGFITIKWAISFVWEVSRGWRVLRYSIVTNFTTLAGQLIYGSSTSPIFPLTSLSRPIQPNEWNEPGLEVSGAINELEGLVPVLSEYTRHAMWISCIICEADYVVENRLYAHSYEPDE